jgi:hypothetical protein
MTGRVRQQQSSDVSSRVASAAACKPDAEATVSNAPRVFAHAGLPAAEFLAILAVGATVASLCWQRASPGRVAAWSIPCARPVRRKRDQVASLAAPAGRQHQRRQSSSRIATSSTTALTGLRLGHQAERGGLQR